MTRLIPKSRISPIDTVKYERRNKTDGRNMPLVYQCARAWDKLDKFRKERDRNNEFENRTGR